MTRAARARQAPVGFMLSATVCLALAACGVPRFGPSARLISGEGWHMICMPTDSIDRYTVGFDIATVQGRGPITIRDARLSHGDGARTGPVEVFPLKRSDHYAAFGMWRGYPPRIDDHGAGERAAWERRVPAIGATLVPRKRGYDFLIGLSVPKIGDSTGWIGPLVVEYADAHGGRGTWTSANTYRLKGSCEL